MEAEMTFVPYRMLRNTPGELRRKLKEAGHLIVTGDGEPFAVMLSVESGEVEQVLETVLRLRAQQAVRRMRETARERGLGSLSEAEIEAEIRAARKER
uniref:Prevent-host-death protein n=1 Tax=Bellilinea caldifistulae TaxID=360411 RepID=A0A7C4L195_9CHLR